LLTEIKSQKSKVNSQESRVKIFVLLLTSYFLLLTAGAEAVDLSRPIVKIAIKGNDRVHESSIRYYISLKEGELYSPIKVRNDIKKIYELGYFDDIKVELDESAEGIIVVYVLKEKPFIKDVNIKGNKEVETFEIKKNFRLKRASILKATLSRKTLIR
jgi:outer membrane protein insertion porin family